jgi:hypothetical protein
MRSFSEYVKTVITSIDELSSSASQAARLRCGGLENMLVCFRFSSLRYCMGFSIFPLA